METGGNEWVGVGAKKRAFALSVRPWVWVERLHCQAPPSLWLCVVGVVHMRGGVREDICRVMVVASLHKERDFFPSLAQVLV